MGTNSYTLEGTKDYTALGLKAGALTLGVKDEDVLVKLVG